MGKINIQKIDAAIFLIHGQKVVLDRVAADPEGEPQLEVPNWHLKLGRNKVSTPCFLET